MSPEAAAYLGDLEHLAAAAAPIEITPETVEQYRQDHRDGYRDDCEIALRATGADTTTVDLGGVSTLKVSAEPRHDAAGLYFFGGAFVAGGPDEDVTITAPIAARVGIPVYGPFYPLSPEHPFPAALDAGVAAYRALLDDISPDRVVVFGESAGGNLAVAVTLKAMRDGLPPPGAVVGISPAADLNYAGRSITYDADPTMPSVENWRRVLHQYLGAASALDPLVSPIYAEYTSAFPPTLITTGTRDVLLSDCARLSTVMRRGGVDVTLHVWEEMWHVFEHWYDLPEGAASRMEIAEFIARHLGLEVGSPPGETP